MKQLYINSKRLVLDSDNTYFPFTYKVSDIENVNIIGVPVSKTIEIPRCQTNDEIFGFIGELSRVNAGSSDDLVSISFNQTKKATYRLIDESQIVSTGLLIVTNVNKNSYEVELVDIIVDKIEAFSNKYLNDLDIINDDNTVFDKKLNAAAVVNSFNSNVLTPLVNIKDRDSDGTTISCKTTNGTSIPVMTTRELPTDCTPIQVKSMKNGDFDYGIKLRRVIDSFNKTNNSEYSTADYPNIIIADNAKNMFEEVNLLLIPKKEQSFVEDVTMDGFNIPSFVNSPLNNLKFKYPVNIDGVSIEQRNGNYYFSIPFEFTATRGTTPTTVLTKYNNILYHDTDTNYGDVLGNLQFNTYLSSDWNGYGERYSSIPQTTNIVLRKGVNTTFTFDGSGNVLTCNVSGSMLIKTDYYPNLLGYTYPMNINFDFAPYAVATRNTILFGQGTCNNAMTVSDSLVTYTKLDIATGDHLNGKVLYPSISLKDFILDTCKYFNLGIKVNDDNNLELFKKEYHISPDVLIIDDDATTVNTNIINNSQIRLTYGLADNPLLKSYEDQNNQKYGEQIINTGYSIKENIQSIEFGVSVPFYMNDTNNYAYDQFAGQFNGGYSRKSFGCTNGFEDRLVFGYPKLVDDFIYISDDSFYEAGMKSVYDTRVPTEKQFTMLNSLLTYNTTTNQYAFGDALEYNDTYSVKSNTFYTLAPYIFADTVVPDTVIDKSLELNKPIYNYANLRDDNYPEPATAYYKYYKNQLSDRFNVDTHILKVKMYINGNPDIWGIYNIKNSNYIIYNLPEYDPTQPGMYEVELLRVNDVDKYLNVYGIEYAKQNTKAVSNIVNTSATSGGVISFQGDDRVLVRGLVWSEDPKPTVSSYEGITAITDPVLDYNSVMTGLTNNKTYYVRAYSTNNFGTSYGDQVKFTSLSVPSITTTPVSAVTNNSALSGGSSISLNGGTMINAGVCWNTTGSPTISDSKTTNVTSPVNFSASITGLAQLTTYYVRAYCTSNIGTAYGLEYSFTTYGLPTVTTADITNVNSTSATSGGNVIAENGSTVSSKGLCWATHTNPTLSDSYVSSGAGIGSYVSNMTGLSTNTTYYVKAYATNGYGTAYGNQLSFDTQALASITIANTTSVTTNSAVSGGNVLDENGTPVTAKGVCWATNPIDATITGNHTTDGTGLGSFVSNITGLTPLTTYYVRAYATNSTGTSYSNTNTFTTYDVPATTTGDPYSISYQSAVIAGQITSAGGTTITNKGFVWKLGTGSFDVNTNDGIYNDGAGSNNFSHTMANLSSGSTYYVKSFATNAFGTTYSAIKSFTTLTAIPAYVTTSAFTSNLTVNSVTCSGTLIATGGSVIGRKGICYSTGSTPTIADSVSYTTDGSIGTYSRDLTGLLDDTTYYYRAYATGSDTNITGYGDVYSFTTLNSPDAPTVTTNSYSITSFSSVIGYGTVVSARGSAILQRGMVLATHSNPTLSDTVYINGLTTIGSQFGQDMNNLNENTTYYFRCYATNAIGTGYGSVLSFTTPDVDLPTVTTSSAVQSITASTAIVFGEVVSDGGDNVVNRGFIWSATPGVNMSNYTGAISNGYGVGSISNEITGLYMDTTYYVRAFGTNGLGTGLGAEVSFTTLSTVQIPSVTTTGLLSVDQNSAILGGNLTSAGGGTVSEKGFVYSIGSTASPKLTELAVASDGTALYYGNGPAGYGSGVWLSVNIRFGISQGSYDFISDDTFSFEAMTATLWGRDDTGEVFNMTDDIISFNDADLIKVWSYSAGDMICTMYKDYSSHFYGSAYDLAAECSIAGGINDDVTFQTSIGDIIWYDSNLLFYPVYYNVSGTTKFSAVANYNPVTPTVSNSKVYVANSDLGEYTNIISGLTPDALYSYRAYAINQAGTAYGSVMNVSTNK